jgi:hypothetical protein
LCKARVPELREHRLIGPACFFGLTLRLENPCLAEPRYGCAEACGVSAGHFPEKLECFVQLALRFRVRREARVRSREELVIRVLLDEVPQLRVRLRVLAFCTEPIREEQHRIRGRGRSGEFFRDRFQLLSALGLRECFCGLSP